MEKKQNRNEYLKNFKEFRVKVELNEELIEKLRKHEYEYFRNHIKNIEGLTNEEKKVFILLEFTRERKSCAEIIKLLKESNQETAANELERYNTSPGLMNINKLSTDTQIPVDVANLPKEGSLIYEMIRNPRGKCLIINNEKRIFRETIRFEHVFNELYFDVETAYNLNVQQIEDKLKDLSKDERLIGDEALIVMIIGHGRDEKILGSGPDDLMKISDIVDIFSPENCEAMNHKKPKIFIFDCCREKVQIPSVEITSSTSGKQKRTELSKDLKTEYQTDHKNEKFSLKFNFANNEWVNKNSDTFIIYSCSEGYESYTLKESFLKDGITAFGQVFSHAIARYACDETLQDIMIRTCKAMKQLEGSGNYSAPELRAHCVEQSVYFNVGHPKNDPNIITEPIPERTRLTK